MVLGNVDCTSNLICKGEKFLTITYAFHQIHELSTKDAISVELL